MYMKLFLRVVELYSMVLQNVSDVFFHLKAHGYPPKIIKMVKENNS